jgi:peptidoglycan/xylan/chitin deacetylase (PgdA/CDA1 family)
MTIQDASLAGIAAAVTRAGLRRSAARIGLALDYHALAERPGDARRALLPGHAAARFAEHLQHVRDHYRVVAAEDLVDAVRARRRGEPIPVAITFDDDLRSHVDLALPILDALGVPATFFLTGASLERPAPFWWERLDAAVAGGLNERERADLARIAGCAPADLLPHRLRATQAVLHRAGPARLEALNRRLEALQPVPVNAGLRAEDVARLAASGHAIGFHTRAHHRLIELDDAQLRRALREGLEALTAAAGRRPTAIAYPHGRAGRREAQAARRAGFTCGFTVRPEPVTARTDRWRIPRLTPSYGSVDRFALKLVMALTGLWRTWKSGLFAAELHHGSARVVHWNIGGERPVRSAHR